MELKNFQILRYIKKWRYLILISLVSGGIVFYVVIIQKQVYTANTVISYTNGEAKYGKTPSGADIDVSRIYSSTVVASAIENLDLDIGVDYIRNRISVEPVVSEEELTRKEALLTEGEVYDEIPTEYSISFSVGSDYSEDFAKNVLNAVLSSYFTYYGDRYVSQTIKPNDVQMLTERKYDYIESVDIMKQSIEDILQYLYSNEETYRASSTGYSFYDLETQYTLIRDVSIDRLYADILSGKVTKDRDILIEKYKMDIEVLNLQMEKAQNQANSLLELMEQYNPKILEAQENSTAQNDAESSNSIILQDIYERRDEDGSISYSENTYDTLMDTYVQYSTEVYRLEQEIAEKQYILEVFTDDEIPTDIMNEAEIKERIQTLEKQLNSMYELVDQTGREYNQYLVGKNISVNSSVNVSSHLNLKVYLLLTVALFGGIGCAGAILLGRAGEIIEYMLYIDKKTQLPNRLSCDEQIKKISSQGAIDLFTCVCLNVINLKEINMKYGRAAGDEALKEIGIILTGLSKIYGFIGYNGGNQFLCLLENSSLDQATSMLDSLEEAMKVLNDKNSDYVIEMTAKTAESKHDDIYQLDKLISHTYEKKERKIS